MDSGNTTSSATTPIKDYINSTLTQIKDGLPDYAKIGGIVTLEISTISQQKKEGGFDIRVLNYGANISENVIQKMTIPIKIMSEIDVAQEEALIAKALVDYSQYENRIAGTISDLSRRRKSLHK